MTTMTAPLALVVRFTLHEGAEPAFDQLVARTVDRIRSDEPRTLIYTCHVDPSAPRDRVFYELYQDQAAFEEHERQPHVQVFLEERKAFVADLSVDFLSMRTGKVPGAGVTS